MNKNLVFLVFLDFLLYDPFNYDNTRRRVNQYAKWTLKRFIVLRQSPDYTREKGLAFAKQYVDSVSKPYMTATGPRARYPVKPESLLKRLEELYDKMG